MLIFKESNLFLLIISSILSSTQAVLIITPTDNTDLEYSLKLSSTHSCTIHLQNLRDSPPPSSVLEEIILSNNAGFLTWTVNLRLIHPVDNFHETCTLNVIIQGNTTLLETLGLVHMNRHNYRNGPILIFVIVTELCPDEVQELRFIDNMENLFIHFPTNCSDVQESKEFFPNTLFIPGPKGSGFFSKVTTELNSELIGSNQNLYNWHSHKPPEIVLELMMMSRGNTCPLLLQSPYNLNGLDEQLYPERCTTTDELLLITLRNKVNFTIGKRYSQLGGNNIIQTGRLFHQGVTKRSRFFESHMLVGKLLYCDTAAVLQRVGFSILWFPFHVHLWIGIVIALIASAICLSLKHLRLNWMTVKLVFDNIFRSFRTFLGQETGMEADNVIFLGLGLAGLTLLTAYDELLMSDLAAPLDPRPIDDRELFELKSLGYKIGHPYFNLIGEKDVVQSISGGDQSAYQKLLFMEVTQSLSLDELILKPNELRESFRNKIMFHTQGRKDLIDILLKYVRALISSWPCAFLREKLSESKSVIVFETRGSREMISFAKNIREAGILSQWEEWEYELKRKEMRRFLRKEVDYYYYFDSVYLVMLKNLYPIFVLWGGLLLLALGIWFIECAVFYVNIFKIISWIRQTIKCIILWGRCLVRFCRHCGQIVAARFHELRIIMKSPQFL
jgi:hypothetical protein